MLKRLYANNFRCLVNFELKFDELTLLLGPNGSGKSTIFDLLSGIRRLLADNARISDAFPPEEFTAWIDCPEQTQTFELDVQGHDGLFSYKLVTTFMKSTKKQRIDIEQLLHDGKPVFQFQKGEVQLYHDDHQLGPKYSFDWTVSALATIGERNDNKKLSWFKKWISSLMIVSPQPRSMTSETKDESAWLDPNGLNFASWYRYISQEHQDKIMALSEKLRKVIPGFHAFKLELAGKHRILKAGFINGDHNASPLFFDFEQLSDGQRQLIVLYSLLIGLKHTVLLDEPENYLALAEIQPWLMELKDACGESLNQAVLISHHPELIDYLGRECGKWIEREPLGPVREKNLPEKFTNGFRLSEQIARGWTE
ncbi:MAG: ATP-binding protein [Candidatus Wallbacteria bacterium]|nr:ATP-binding protein [Candidatus Wallbacteria bacterium]